MTEHRDHGDENDNHLKDRKFKSGEEVRHCVMLLSDGYDMDPQEVLDAANSLIEWCNWKDIEPVCFGPEYDHLGKLMSVWVKGVQR